MNPVDINKILAIKSIQARFKYGEYQVNNRDVMRIFGHKLPDDDYLPIDEICRMLSYMEESEAQLLSTWIRDVFAIMKKSIEYREFTHNVYEVIDNLEKLRNEFNENL
jgi:deoxyhypusine synthase